MERTTKQYKVVERNGDFEFCAEGVPYKSFSGKIKNKLTGDIFEGSITVYKFLQPDGTWKINEEDDIYCLPDDGSEE